MKPFGLFFKYYVLVITFFTITSCSLFNNSMRKMAVTSTAHIMDAASVDFTKEDNYRFFKDSMPGNLKMLEGLHFNQPENLILLKNLIKGHAGFAFAVGETEFLAFALNEEAQGEAQDNEGYQLASFHYNRALHFAKIYFQVKKISWTEIVKQNEMENLVSLYNKKLSYSKSNSANSNDHKNDLVFAFYFAQSLGGLINLHRNNSELLSLLPVVKTTMDWVCDKVPNIELGGCGLFYAIYEAGRPQMLGGNPEKGRALFKQMMEDRPYNLLNTVGYLQFSILPMMEEEEYKTVSKKLEKEFSLWLDQLEFSRQTTLTSNVYSEHTQFNLYNAIARRRFEIMRQFEEKLF